MKKRILSFVMVVLMVLSVAAPVISTNPIEAYAAETGEWVGAWGTGITVADFDDLSKVLISAGDCTIRIVVKPTISGDKIRFKLSNKYGTAPVEINRMTVASVTEGSNINEKSTKQVTVNNQRGVEIPAGQEIYTDAISFAVTANKEIALNIYFAKSDIDMMQSITTAGLSGGRAYITSENKTKDESIDTELGPIQLPPKMITHGTVNAVPLLSDIDVYTEAEDPYSVVVIGDSTVANNIPEYLARLIESEGCDSVGVVGKGIIGNSLLTSGGGTSGSVFGEALLNRMWRDVVDQTNVRCVVLKIGASDIILPKSINIANYGKYIQPTASELIKGFETFIDRCHENDIKVIACSITPWKGTTYNYFGNGNDLKYTWTESDWRIAEDVNKWLASASKLDGFVDLNAVTVSSRDPQKIRDEWTEDYINPNETAQQAWAEEIPLHLIGVEYSPAKVKLSESSISLTKGKTKTLKHTITPASAQNADVTWTSSNPAVASVNQSGKVTAKGNGTATITCETYNGKKDTCKVTVTTLTNKITLSATSLKMYTTQTKTIKATIAPSSASNKNVKWTSSDTKVAKVSSKGKVTAVGKGTATITCTTDDTGIVATCKVTVTKKISVKSIALNKTSKTVYKGKTYQLTATVKPSNASNQKVTWKSSNTSVATVSSTGKVTAKKNGKANIMATTSDGKLVATCKITVKTKATGVTVKSTANAYIGKTITLKATVKPSSASNKNVTWKSSNTSIATVNSKGVVTGKKVGTVTITVTTKDGKYKDSCTVKVSKYVKTKDVELNKSKKTLNVGDTYTLKATVSPSNASIKGVTWKSSNTKVAKVSSSGKITAVGKGTATITVTTKDGKIKDKCKVTVKTVKVKSVKLNETKLRLMVGDSDKLKATISPSNATNKAVTWKSSNSAIAKVSSSGKVTGISKGTATITCTTKDGKIKKTCKVTVYGVPTDPNQKVMGVRLNKSNLTLKNGKTYQLIATVVPNDAANQKVTWSSDNTSVATVNSKGKITAKKAGKAVISVRTADGGWKASCVVTVN